MSESVSQSTNIHQQHPPTATLFDIDSRLATKALGMRVGKATSCQPVDCTHKDAQSIFFYELSNVKAIEDGRFPFCSEASYIGRMSLFT